MAGPEHRLYPRWLRERLARHRRLQSFVRHVRDWLPPANFIAIHYGYFIVTCLITSLIFWGSSSPSFRVGYVDSLFLVVSAMTQAGLNPVNLSQITTWQQVLLWLLIIIGSTVWVSIWTVLARKHVFEKRFDAIVLSERERTIKRRKSLKAMPIMERIRSLQKSQSTPPPGDIIIQGLGSRITAGVSNASLQEPDQDSPRSVLPHPTSSMATEPANPPTPTLRDGSLEEPTSTAASAAAAEDDDTTRRDSHIAFTEDVRPNAAATSVYRPGNRPSKRNPRMSSMAKSDGDEEEPLHWRNILTRRNVGRNAQFHGLSSDERERLGGYEYRALKMLAIVVPLYAFLWQFLGALALGAWIANYSLDTAASNGVGAWWAGIFYAVSAFNNNGMSVIDLNMIPFQQAYFVLIAMSLLILAGNTAYPLFLRLIFWSVWRFLELTTNTSAFCDTKTTLEFILKYPRRIYTHLFPSRPTWWLLFMLILLNSIDWILFEVLNIGNPTIESIPLGPRILDGLFQAIGRIGPPHPHPP
jgi:hypothetical protein